MAYRNDISVSERAHGRRRARAWRRPWRPRARGRQLPDWRAPEEDVRQGSGGRRLDGSVRGGRHRQPDALSRRSSWDAKKGIQGGNCDNGYSCAYSNSISWRTPSTPNPPEIRPRAVFERLFGSARVERDPVKARPAGEISEERARFRAAGRQTARNAPWAWRIARKLDEYMYAVRDIETRIQKTESDNALNPEMDRPSSSVPENYNEHTRIMFDLMSDGVPDRLDAHHHVPDGHRAEQPRVSRDRDRRFPSRPDPSRRRQGKDREVHQHQSIPGRAVRVFHRQAEGDQGWRRHAVRPRRWSPTAAASAGITITTTCRR